MVKGRKGKGLALSTKIANAVKLADRRSSRKRKAGNGNEGGAAPDNDGDSTNTVQPTPATNTVDAAKDSIVVTIGKDNGLLFQKPRRRVQTRQKLKSKCVAHDNVAELARPQSESTPTAKTLWEPPRMPNASDPRRRCTCQSGGLKTHIDVIVMSPLKHSKSQKAPPSSESDSISESAKDRHPISTLSLWNDRSKYSGSRSKTDLLITIGDNEMSGQADKVGGEMSIAAPQQCSHSRQTTPPVHSSQATTPCHPGEGSVHGTVHEDVVLRKEATTLERSTAVVEEVPISPQKREHASDPLKEQDVADTPTVQAALEMPSSGGESRLPRVECRLAERFKECGGFGSILLDPRRHTTEKEVEIDPAISSRTPPANEI
jgi:hypothetical protein